MKAILLAIPFVALAPKSPAKAPTTATSVKSVTTVKAVKTAPKALTAGKLTTQEAQLATKLRAFQPLSRSKLVDAAKVVAGSEPVVDEPRAFTLSPRTPFHEGAFMNFVGGNVWAAVAGDIDRPPSVTMGAASSSSAFNRYVEVSFPTRDGYVYMLDCQTTASSHHVIRNFHGSTLSTIRTDNGHLLVPLARRTADGRATFQIAASSMFALSSCEVVPLK